MRLEVIEGKKSAHCYRDRFVTNAFLTKEPKLVGCRPHGSWPEETGLKELGRICTDKSAYLDRSQKVEDNADSKALGGSSGPDRDYAKSALGKSSTGGSKDNSEPMQNALLNLGEAHETE
jgi:hypothetical protein